jgi:hypothetical protein
VSTTVDGTLDTTDDLICRQCDHVSPACQNLDCSQKNADRPAPKAIGRSPVF